MQTIDRPKLRGIILSRKSRRGVIRFTKKIWDFGKSFNFNILAFKNQAAAPILFT